MRSSFLRNAVQFRLRTILVVQLVIAALIAHLAQEIRTRRRQAALAAEIEAEFADRRELFFSVGFTEAAPMWLSRNRIVRSILGETYFSRPQRALLFLRRRHGRRSAVATVSKIGELTSLEELDLHLPRTGNVDLNPLRTLRQLRDLSLDGTPIQRGGLDFIRSLQSLEYLSLTDTGLTDDDARLIGKCARLDLLNLSKTAIGDPTLEQVGRLKRLKHLDISLTNISRDGLKHLRGLAQLEVIDISGTEADETSTGHLAAIGSLQRIVVSDSRIHDPDLEALQRALPNCRIVRESQRNWGTVVGSANR